MSVSTPSAGAATSNATLSVSISTRTSSFFTASPGFLVQRAMVPSVTDSPITGVLISTDVPVAGVAAAGAAGAG
jgi:hypothetical protein